jgi:hypothetical protein
LFALRQSFRLACPVPIKLWEWKEEDSRAKDGLAAAIAAVSDSAVIGDVIYPG